MCFRPKLCLHEFFLIQTNSPARHLGLVGAHSGSCRNGLFRLGRYHRAREGAQAWLLLWVCDVQDHGGLLEDVRVAEICLAVVGGNVREAADESSGGEPGRRTAPAETRACRAGGELALQGFRDKARGGSPKSLARISGISKIA